MKKILSILLSLVLIMSLVACGSNNEKNPGGDKKAKEPGDIKVALLVGLIGDMSFNDSAVRGIEKAEKELGIKTKVIEYGNQTDKFEPTLLDAAEEGYDMIFASNAMLDYIEKYAKDYRDTTFVLFDGEVNYDKGDMDNVYSIIYSANEGAFVGGYLSAKLSKTGILGFLGGIEAPVINDFLVGFIEGAKLAREDIKVTVSYVGNYVDSSKGKELSFTMNSAGADMIFNVAGNAGVGLIEAAAEKDFNVLGVDSDQALIYEAQNNTKFAEKIPTSVLKNVDESLFRAIDLYMKGELPVGKTEHLGIKENGMGLAENKYYEKMVTPELREEVDQLLEKIKDGEIKVDTAYGKTTEEIANLRNTVKP